LLLGEAAAEILLVGNGLPADQPEDLTVAKCFPRTHAKTNIRPSAFLYNLFLNGDQELPMMPVGAGLPGGKGGAGRGHAGLGTLSGSGLDFRREEWLPILSAIDCAPNGHTVQSYGMQERLAAGSSGTASLRIAFHAID
ncbi:MAG: hypothetical protein ACRD36_13615, partial [Candidatus Acidiferrum sp.]